HYAPLAEAQMSLVGGAPSGAVAAENIRHFELWTGHRRRVNPALSLPCSGVRVGFEPAGSCRSQRAHSPRSTCCADGQAGPGSREGARLVGVGGPKTYGAACGRCPTCGGQPPRPPADTPVATRASSLAVMDCGRETASAAAGYGANSREECRAVAWIRPYSDPAPLCLAGRRRPYVHCRYPAPLVYSPRRYGERPS